MSIVMSLNHPEYTLLQLPEDEEDGTTLLAPLHTSRNLYKDLQETYHDYDWKFWAEK